MVRLRYFVVLALLAFAGCPSFGQIVLTPKNTDGLYGPGESAVWTVKPGPKSKTTSATYTLRKNGTAILKQGTIDLSSGSGKIEIGLEEPGQVALEVIPPGLAPSLAPATAPSTTRGHRRGKSIGTMASTSVQNASGVTNTETVSSGAWAKSPNREAICASSKPARFHRNARSMCRSPLDGPGRMPECGYCRVGSTCHRVLG
jgi:hypothetical protein